MEWLDTSTSLTTEPLVDPTDALTTVPTEASTEAPAEPTETTTGFSTDLSSVYNDCQFSKGDSSAFFDSGSPYRNDMRHGFLTSNHRIFQ